MPTRTQRRRRGSQASSLKSQACPHPAGSPGKIAALRARVANRQPLFHPGDNQSIAGKVSCPTSDDPLLDAMRLYAPIETAALKKG